MYLIDMGGCPLTAADIRADLGFECADFDPMIESAIAVAHCNMRAPVCPQVWSIRFDQWFDATVARMGTATKIGPMYQRPGPDSSLWRDVSFAADPEAVEAARKWVLAWCNRQDDLVFAMNEERRGKAA